MYAFSFLSFLFIYIQLYTITDKIPSHPFDEYNIDRTYLAVKISSVYVSRLPNMCYKITSVRKPVYQNCYVQYIEYLYNFIFSVDIEIFILFMVFGFHNSIFVSFYVTYL